MQDTDGESPDWIELRNFSAAPVDLAGWGLRDDRRNPVPCEFPSVILPPGGYAIVFASGKDRAVAGAEVHADF